VTGAARPLVDVTIPPVRWPAPPLLARLMDRLRALPAANPAYPADALLIAADWCTEAAVHAEIAGQTGASDAHRDMALLFRTAADRARALAPIFAHQGDRA
jgi:hypothetical protein